ncbi:MAG: hypothetical protein Fur0010_27310 [Bdellovibrio sp.]
MKKSLLLAILLLSQALWAQEEAEISDDLPEIEVSSVDQKLNAIGIGGGIDYGTTAVSVLLSRQLNDRHALDFHASKTSKKDVKGAEQLMNTESTSFALSDRMRLTDSESFYVRAGIYREQLFINNKTETIAIKLNGRDIGQKSESTYIGASASIGNKFNYDNMFLTIDWVGVNIPVSIENEFEAIEKSDLRLLNVNAALTF